MKTSKTILSIIFLFVCIIVKSQITTNENPISFTQPNVRSVAKVMKITPPNMQKVYVEDKEKTSGVLNRIAVAVPVNLSIEKDGEWEQLPNGDKLWKLTLSVKNALFLDVSFDKFWLPKGGKFFVYNRQTQQVIGAITDEFLRGTRQNPSDFATAMIKGDEITLEYYQPFNCKEFPIINTSKLYYGYKNISVFSRSSGTGFGTSDSCNINVNCKEGKKWQDEKKAIARILIKSSEGSFWGSGALLNNTNNNLEPLLLTAHHNLKGIFDAVSDPIMSKAIFYWDYEFSSCSNSSVEPWYKTTLGADVIANKEYTDFALLKLRQDPRDLTNFIPYYLGWDKSGNTGTGSIGIHHPKGDVKKISISSSSATNESRRLNWPDGTRSNRNTHWKVTFTEGFTEGGSSGSPLLNNERKVIGQLHGGLNSSMCNNDTEYYGKFNLSWTGNGATDNRRKLQPWLDPLGTNQNTIEGRYPFAILGDDTICGQGNYTYTLQNASIYYHMTWQVSSNLQIVSSTNGSVTVKKVGNGSGYIKVIHNDVVIEKKVWLGVPNVISIFDQSQQRHNNTESNQLCKSYTYEERNKRIIDVKGPVSDYEWRKLIDNYGFTTHNNTVWFLPYQLGFIGIELRVKNKCGWSNWQFFGYNVVDCDNNVFSMYPNPASGSVTLKLEESFQKSAQKSTFRSVHQLEYQVDIYNMSGFKVRSVRAKESEIQIPLQGLLPGIYAVHLLKDGKVYKKKLVVE